jgi:hypothetical protein
MHVTSSYMSERFSLQKDMLLQCHIGWNICNRSIYFLYCVVSSGKKKGRGYIGTQTIATDLVVSSCPTLAWATAVTDSDIIARRYYASQQRRQHCNNGPHGLLLQYCNIVKRIEVFQNHRRVKDFRFKPGCSLASTLVITFSCFLMPSVYINEIGFLFIIELPTIYFWFLICEICFLFFPTELVHPNEMEPKLS